MTGMRTMDERKRIRLTGLAGILGALLMYAGDMFLYGGFYSGSEFADYSRKIMSEIPVFRLMIGGAVAPIAVILYSIGFWHVFLAVKNGSRVLAAVSFSGLVAMISFGGVFHAGFVYTGLLLRAKRTIHEIDMKIIETLLKQASDYLQLIFMISIIFGTIGTTLFIYTVLFQKTSYPKWMVLFAPGLLIFTSPLARMLPAPVGGILYGGVINFVFLLFFCVSTFTLWNCKIKKSEY
jgi:hypothetical protein